MTWWLWIGIPIAAYLVWKLLCIGIFQFTSPHRQGRSVIGLQINKHHVPEKAVPAGIVEVAIGAAISASARNISAMISEPKNSDLDRKAFYQNLIYFGDIIALGALDRLEGKEDCELFEQLKASGAKRNALQNR